MKRLITGLFIATGAVVLAVGALAAVEILLSSPERKRATTPKAIDPLPVPEPVTAPEPARRNFSIKRTKSEVGFVYWILQGYGSHKCYILCDTWEEAVEQARLKSAEVSSALVAV